jgi:ubiquinone/menaquinone biosynthesis C-methylase UbiE
MDKLQSRFFTKPDFNKDMIVFQLLPSWWSRPYEYAWAGTFTEKDDVVLDAACGIEHPFKFYLLDRCREVYACDYDKSILSSKDILNAVKNTFGEEASREFPSRYLNNIHYNRASLTSLPYKDKMFDKIYCISVLEHLKDYFNKYPLLTHMSFMKIFLKNDIYIALKEFKRILKNNGLIIMTFDYPNINLSYLKKAVEKLELSFAGNISLDLPDNALYSKELNLNCFRAVINKLK